jgi:hypothetical protein
MNITWTEYRYGDIVQSYGLIKPRLSSKQAYNLGKQSRKSREKNPFDKDTENDLRLAWQKGFNTVDFPRP